MVYESDKMVKGSGSVRGSKTHLKLADVGHVCDQSATAPKRGVPLGDLACPARSSRVTGRHRRQGPKNSHRRTGARSRDKRL